MRVIIKASYSSRNQEQSEEQRCHPAFSALVHFCYAVCCCCCVCITPQAFDVVVTTGITEAVLQGLRSVTATAVCACVRIMWARHPEHNKGQFQLTLPLNFKSVPPYSSGTTAAAKRGTTPVNIATLIYIGTPAPPCQLATPPCCVISSQPHPEGKACKYTQVRPKYIKYIIYIAVL